MTTTRTTAVPDPRDAALSARALDGDRDAFAELFTRHESGLLNVCARMTGRPQDAPDLVQESFLRVFARLDQLRGRQINLPAYLYRTARNLVYDHSGTSSETPTDDIALAAGSDPDLEVDPARAALLSEQQRLVREANSRLPERQRLALALRELEDMDYPQIGEVLDLRPDAVAQLLVRARASLRRELRLGAVDHAALSPSCQARLGTIGALLDDQLDADRALVLGQHLQTCAQCRAARDEMREAKVRYRAWLPLVPLGMAPSVARAAEDRGLLATRRSSVSDVRPPRAPVAPNREPDAFSDDRERHRRRVAVVAGAAALLILGTVSAVVALPRTGAETLKATVRTAPQTAPSPPPVTPRRADAEIPTTREVTTVAAAPSTVPPTAVPAAPTSRSITRAAPPAPRRRAVPQTRVQTIEVPTPSTAEAPQTPPPAPPTPAAPDPASPPTTSEPPPSAPPTTTTPPPVVTDPPPRPPRPPRPPIGDTPSIAAPPNPPAPPPVP